MVPGRPHLVSARKWARATRSVSHVALDLSGAAPTAVVHGIGRRLPYARPVPLELALGLTALGVWTSSASGATR